MQSPANVSLTLSFAFITFAVWVAAYALYFRRGSGVKAPAVVLTVVGGCAVVGHLYVLATADVSFTGAVMGCSMYVLALSLFLWSLWTAGRRRLGLAFSGAGTDEVLQDGPYRYIRHPIYVSYGVGWFATIVATHNAALLGPLAVLIVLYYLAARSEEAAIMNSPQATKYREYKRCVGAILPKWHPTAIGWR